LGQRGAGYCASRKPGACSPTPGTIFAADAVNSRNNGVSEERGLKFSLVVPPKEEQQRIQSAESRHYWSRCSEVIFWRHGLEVNIRSDNQRGAQGDAEVVVFMRGVSGTRASSELAVFEGPLSEKLLRFLGLQAVGFPRGTERLRLASTSQGELGDLTFTSPMVRDFRSRGTTPDSEAVYRNKTTDLRWGTLSFPVQQFVESAGWRTVLEADIDGSRQAVAVTDGKKIVFGFPIFDLLTSAHAFPPLSDGYWSSETSAGNYKVERELIRLLGGLGASGITEEDNRGHWPHGAKFAVSFRFDFDRDISKFELWRLLRLLDMAGIRASFGFKTGSTQLRHAKSIIDAGHEINLHTLSGNRDELECEKGALEKATQVTVSGFHSHGGVPSPGHLGGHHHHWAAQLGFDYAEMIAGNSLFPYFLLRSDSTLPEITDVMAPAEHCSIDLGMSSQAVNLGGVIKHLKRVEEFGGHAVVMNHPDIHYRQLRSVIRYLKNRDVWAAPLFEVIACIKDRRKRFLPAYEAKPLPRENN
jgi:hypothetical protein